MSLKRNQRSLLRLNNLHLPSESTELERRHEEVTESSAEYMVRVTVPKIKGSPQPDRLEARTNSPQVHEDLYDYDEIKLMDRVTQLKPTVGLCFSNNDNDIKLDNSSSTSEEKRDVCTSVCRLCLAAGVRLVPIAGALCLLYEKLTDTALHTLDGRPVAACYICHAQLNKCLRLMLTSARAEQVLNDILRRNSKITVEAVSSVDRSAAGLCGALTRSRPECLWSGPGGAGGVGPETPAVKREPASGDCSDAEDYEADAAFAEVSDTQCVSDDDGNDARGDGDHTNFRETSLIYDAAPSSERKSKQKKGIGTKSTRRQNTPKIRGPQHCDVCHRKFKTASELKRHYVVHSGEKPYQCDICQRQFTWKCNLSKHILTHTGEKLYKCEVCPKGFIKKSNLVIHLRSHTGEKPFACEKCSQSFSNKFNLARHVRTHTGEKRYKCDLCDRKFHQKAHVTSHMKTHSDGKQLIRENCAFQTEAKNLLSDNQKAQKSGKPVKCDLCPAQFSQRNSLLYHMRVHNGEKPYECGVCQYRCRQKGALQGHMRTHTGEKPFKCELCERRFTFKRDVARHAMTHTGEKPFACHVCPRMFIQKANLLRHLVTHERPRTRRKAPKDP